MYRARVVELYEEAVLGPHARLYFLDEGHTRWVPLCQMREVGRVLLKRGE